MIKRLIIILLVCSSSALLSQGFGIKAGISYANQELSENGININSDTKSGFNIGAFYEVILLDGFYIRPGVAYFAKGSNFNLSSFFGEQKSSFRYLEIPLDIVFKIKLNRLAVTAFGGPYMAIEMDGVEGIETESIDYGINVGGGLEFGKFLFGTSYGIGINNILANELNVNSSLKNRTLNFYIGYRFFNEE